MSSSNLTGDCAVNGIGHGVARFPILAPILAAAVGVGAYCYQPCDGDWFRVMKDGAYQWECVIKK